MLSLKIHMGILFIIWFFCVTNWLFRDELRREYKFVHVSLGAAFLFALVEAFIWPVWFFFFT